jgi:hypothetical protein
MRSRQMMGLLGGVVLCAHEVFAASSGLPDSLQACTRERDDARRLACYDREMAQLAAPPVAAAGAPPAVTAPAATTSADRTFGLPAEKPKPQTLSSTVTSVNMRSDGRLLIALANGQVWVQGDAYEAFRVAVGDAITIKPGALGSLHLYAPSGRATRVTRAR